MPDSRLMRLFLAGAAAAGATAYQGFRKEFGALCAAVDSGGTIASTAVGPIEYAEVGQGEPLLVVHGAGGGYDQGLLLAADLGMGYRVISPSRFGYLKTPVPNDPSPITQADAHAALLGHLGIGSAIVVGASAGAPSAIELALRHPERVSALILLGPRTYHPDLSVGADESPESQAVLRLVEMGADFLFWIAMRIARRSVVRFLGVPPKVEAKASRRDRERVTRMIHSILPLSRRVQGIRVDGAAEIRPWPLDQISCPVLIISAQDDLYRTLPGARFTAAAIPRAELHVLKSGGHLMVGQAERVQGLVANFLKRRPLGGSEGQARHHT